MEKSIYSIYGLDKEAAESVINKVLAVQSADLEIVNYCFDEPRKAVFFEVARHDGESNYLMNRRFCRLTGIAHFVVHKNFSKRCQLTVAHEVIKPQSQRCGFVKFLIGRLFKSTAV